MNSFLFLSRFFVSLKGLNNYFFIRFAYKSLLNRFPLLINYIIGSSNHFSTSSCFPLFLGSRFFRVRVQDPGPGFRSNHCRYNRQYFFSVCVKPMQNIIMKSEENPWLEILLHLKNCRFLIFVSLHLVLLKNCARL